MGYLLKRRPLALQPNCSKKTEKPEILSNCKDEFKKLFCDYYFLRFIFLKTIKFFFSSAINFFLYGPLYIQKSKKRENDYRLNFQTFSVSSKSVTCLVKIGIQNVRY